MKLFPSKLVVIYKESITKMESMINAWETEQKMLRMLRLFVSDPNGKDIYFEGTV
jgi:hypothetical protein